MSVLCKQRAVHKSGPMLVRHHLEDGFGTWSHSSKRLTLPLQNVTELKYILPHFLIECKSFWGHRKPIYHHLFRPNPHLGVACRNGCKNNEPHLAPPPGRNNPDASDARRRPVFPAEPQLYFAIPAALIVATQAIGSPCLDCKLWERSCEVHASPLFGRVGLDTYLRSFRHGCRYAGLGPPYLRASIAAGAAPTFFASTHVLTSFFLHFSRLFS